MLPWRFVRHVVIVGGGFGGLSAAQGLAGEDVRVTLLDRSNHHLFQPLLYQVAMAGLSPADIAYPIRGVLHRQTNARTLLGEVVSVDLARRSLTTLDGEHIDWDYLVVAVGAKSNYFGNEARWGRWALGLKTLDDAVEIRRRVLLAFEAAEREVDAEQRKRLLTFVVIGGGPTGVEVAGALSDLARTVLADDFREIQPENTRVVLVERGPRLLPGGFVERLGQRALEQLRELGVEVQLETAVEDIDARGVKTSGGEIGSANVFWTAGVRGRRLGEALGAQVDRGKRVIVGQDCSIADHPNAFVIGDVACFTPEGGKGPLPGLAPVALQQGRFVARQIVRSEAGKAREQFRYRDKGIMATIGRSRAVAQSGPLRVSGFLAWLMWLVIHILFLVTFRNRVSVLANWLWNYLTYSRGARLITGERAWMRLGELGVVHDGASDQALSDREEVRR